MYSPPILGEYGSRLGRHFASKSLVYIPDLTADIAVAGESDPVAEAGVRAALFVPMLRNDELIGSFAIGRLHAQPFTEKEIELVADFAAEAAIAQRPST
jgi:GAF domain-containing protein